MQPRMAWLPYLLGFIYLFLPSCRLQNSQFFFSTSVKKLVKRGVKSYSREARQPYTPVGRFWRERKNRLSFFHTMSSLRPGGSKMSSSCQKSVHNSALFVNLIHSVIDFEGEKRVLLSAFGFES